MPVHPGVASKHLDMSRHPGFRAMGWQIGSGPTEATCKALTALLMGSGMCRHASNAESLNALEALSLGCQWG
jgi:hypothetical protein